ncbi:unnamed protein product [Dracunculus medinensis]|uniref:NADH dehydrogenase [ubiquinone] iron-sulfur protein 5 n=1 Tax=Dracunculus medinensis TaxID=318479 RepID=A0A0N4UNT6_DRAME|nr:unnamed protein product [Dracunculus medinensis]
MSSGNRTPDPLVFSTPIIKTPISDKISLPMSQQGRPCGFFEELFFRCMEAYGARLGRIYCDLENRDFRECLTSDKQRKRINAIRNERRRKYRNGEIAEAFEKNFPEFGQYKPDYFSHNRVQ